MPTELEPLVAMAAETVASWTGIRAVQCRVWLGEMAEEG